MADITCIWALSSAPIAFEIAKRMELNPPIDATQSRYVNSILCYSY